MKRQKMLISVRLLLSGISVQSHVFAPIKQVPESNFNRLATNLFWNGCEITLVGEEGRLPEAHDFRSVRQLNDLPAWKYSLKLY